MTPRQAHNAVTTDRLNVKLEIGDRRFRLGDLPASSVPDEIPAYVAANFVKVLAAELERQTDQLKLERDMAALLREYGPTLVDLVIETPDRVDPVGPMAGFLRRQKGISLKAFAEAMERSPGSLRAWEAARPTRYSISDDWRASVFLGYGKTVLLRIAASVQINLRRELLTDR